MPRTQNGDEASTAEENKIEGVYIYTVAGYKITYYSNYYVNLRDYSNFLLSGLL